MISLSFLTAPTSPINSEKLGVIISAPLYLEKLFPLGSTNTFLLNFFAFFINAGIYVLKKAILKQIPKQKKIFNMTDLIEKVKQKKIKVKIFHSYEEWHDVGSHEKANELKIQLIEVTSGTKGFEFDLNTTQRLDLFSEGYNAAKEQYLK